MLQIPSQNTNSNEKNDNVKEKDIQKDSTFVNRKIRKLNGSPIIGIPKPMLDGLDFKIGDTVGIRKTENFIVIGNIEDFLKTEKNLLRDENI